MRSQIKAVGFQWLAASVLWGLSATAAQAVGVRQFSPQGQVRTAQQVVVQLDGAGVRLGDPKAAAPVTLQCSDAKAAQGTGRWNSDKEWVFDFARPLPAGVRCTATLNSSFKSPSGQPLAGTSSYQFQTGGPQVIAIAPETYETVDEQQYFALRLSGAATPESLRQHVWCTAEGVGERIPVQRIEGRERDAVLKQQDWHQDAAQNPGHYAVLTCQRRLTAGSQMTLVYGKGVAMPNGLASQEVQRYAYQVRQPFSAEFQCERENAQAACLPIRPMRLSFSAPVPRKLAEAIRLKTGASAVAATVESPGERLAADSLVDAVVFPATMKASTPYTVELPPQFKDAAGRTLVNAGQFPLATATGPMPPLVKFAAAPFGIIERYAEGPKGSGNPALLPVTLRNVEPQLTGKVLEASVVRTKKGGSDADIIAWLDKVERYDRYSVDRRQASQEVRQLPPVIDEDNKHWVQPRMLSLLDGQPQVKQLQLPKLDKADPRPFEVVGIPLNPGFQVVEIASPMLGQSLLDERYGAGRTMYVRTAALVTNLAVHFKLGRESSLAWVTSLDKGQPVPGAAVQISDCRGRAITSAVTNSQGVANFAGLDPSAPRCDAAAGSSRSGHYFVSARVQTDDGEDMAFVWSDWQKGIEPWRFRAPTSSSAQRDEIAHTIFDRTLLRAGETVSMKHVMRALVGPGDSSHGFALPSRYPDELVITHRGSGQRFTQPLRWSAHGSALSEFALSKAAKLGEYEVQLGYSSREEQSRSQDRRYAITTGTFRVEEFRLPVMEGRVAPRSTEALLAPGSVEGQVQVNYVSGGAAANLPVQVSALLRRKNLDFPGWDEFSFSPSRSAQDSQSSDDEEATASDETQVVLDKQALTLDGSGQATFRIEKLPRMSEARELLMEASYADPNGEVQTLRSTRTLWPAAVVAGVRAEGWASVGRKLRFQALTLDTSGKALAGVPVKVEAISRITTSSRKRLVGGFYSYDNQTTLKSMGTVCSGTSDSHGLLQCEAPMNEAGEVELIVRASDKEGRSTQAATSVWVTGQGELWFGGEDHDRMEVLAERKSYEPGETARFQVRMPFRQATALVAVEREGVVSTEVVELRGDNPTIELKVQPQWGPNVYVSVLALRGRLVEVPWYSFFTWGFKSPAAWWRAFWGEGKDFVAPTAMVDLSKPAFRLGMAEIRVGSQAHRIQVKLSADQAHYKVRGKAKITIEASLPSGKPAAGARVSVAAVDQALLELMPNHSWDLLESMLRRRDWGVQTATAQMEIVGRRHYGKKAVPAGGGGGRSPTRELLDTLLLWQPDVQLDAQGRAQLEVPLNDALSSFQIVAVAEAGTSLFGKGHTQIRTTQDLQIISGLPPLVREDDVFRAQITLRNTSAKAMKVEVSPRATLLELKPQTVDLAAGQAREVAWEVKAPAQLSGTRAEALIWEIAARDLSGGADAAQDALKVSQRIVPAVPLTVQQATLVQVDGSVSWPVAPPADALPGRGGLQMSLVPRLTEGLPGVRDWWARYPYTCLEQTTSKAVGMNSPAQWAALMEQLPNYLDSDGLASYFPLQDGAANRGSDTLTAHLLTLEVLAQSVGTAESRQFRIPAAERARMQEGLIHFVEGRIQRNFWSPRKDLEMRKLAAIAALALTGKATPRMLDSIHIAPHQWPTHAVIDWAMLLQRMKDAPQREERLAQAQNILRSRLQFNGTRAGFSTEQDDQWWWLMQGPEVNLARLILVQVADPGWAADMPRLVSGFIARQQGGAWSTTTANLWGGLALRSFSAHFESEPVSGTTVASLNGQQAQVDWSAVQRSTEGGAKGAAHAASAWGEPVRAAGLVNNTMFMPWSQLGAQAKGQLTVSQQGTGKPWLTVQSVAAVALKAPFASGYSIQKTITPVQQAQKGGPGGSYTRGDVLRVTLQVQAKADMSWVAITDPIPAGATILGSGLGRDSEIATQGEKQQGQGWLAYEERSFESYRAYYQYLPAGRTKIEYSVRLNNSGEFSLPPTRVEALYAPEMFGESPNAKLKVLMPQ